MSTPIARFIKQQGTAVGPAGMRTLRNAHQAVLLGGSKLFLVSATLALDHFCVASVPEQPSHKTSWTSNSRNAGA
jgi:hypothetical protein